MRALVAQSPPRFSSESRELAATPQEWRSWLREPLWWVANADRRDVLKTSSTTTVCRIQLRREDGRYIDAVFKRGRSRHLRKRLLSVLRVSRPMRTWRRAQALIRHQIPTARPLAVLEQRRFGLLLDSAFITEYLPNAVDLENLLTSRMRELSARQGMWLKRRLADALAAFFVQLGAAGFYHRDMKALNIIVQWTPHAADLPRISLVDLDGLKRAWLTRDRGWIRMFMRLNVSVDGFKRVSLTDRLRLLKRFLALSEQNGCWKTAWREIAALSEIKRDARARQQERSFRKYGRY